VSSEQSPRIDFEALVNARDAGGIATDEGGSIRGGVLYRSETPQLMTEADVRRARAELGIGRVVDLRGPRGGGSGPLGEDGRGVVMDFLGVLGQIDTTPDGFLPGLLGKGGLPLTEFLSHFISTEEAVLVHCHTGKDRTGFVVALTLALAGATDADIIADYERSQPVFDTMMANLVVAGLGVPASAPPYAQHAPSSVGITAMMAQLRANWASPQAWALDQGVPLDLIEATRARLRAA
jgi:protein-tyrosine phosphatase